MRAAKITTQKPFKVRSTKWQRHAAKSLALFMRTLRDKHRRETADCGRARMPDNSAGGESRLDCKREPEYAESPAQENNSSVNGVQTDAQTVSAQTPEIVEELRRLQMERRRTSGLDFHESRDISHLSRRARQTPDIYEKSAGFHFGNTRRIKEVVLLEAFDHKCFFCGKEVTFDTATKDHLIPRIDGGHNGLMNLALSCYRCNQEKWNNPATSDQIKRANEIVRAYLRAQSRLDLEMHRKHNMTQNTRVMEGAVNARDSFPNASPAHLSPAGGIQIAPPVNPNE